VRERSIPNCRCERTEAISYARLIAEGDVPLGTPDWKFILMDRPDAARNSLDAMTKPRQGGFTDRCV
jgi:hypothetical protein